MPTASITFLVLAIAFIVIGISGQRVFIYIGIAFLVAALVGWRRRRT